MRIAIRTVVALIMLAVVAALVLPRIWPEAVLAMPQPPARPEAADLEGRGFDLSNLQVPREEIQAGGPPKDGIPALVDPKTAPLDEATGLLDEDRVIGVTVKGESRAYPLKVLNWHEAINDTLGGAPIAVVYCPLCDSATVWDRRLEEKKLEFGISGLLHNSNVLLYDRTDQALWSQVGLGAISGPHAGRSLASLPFAMQTLAEWRKAHPDGTVVTLDTGHTRNYSGNPYADYFASDRLMFHVRRQDDRLPKKEAVVGIKIGAHARAYPLARIQQAEGAVVTDELAGKRVVLKASKSGVEILELPPEAQVVHTFWFTWAAFHPDTDIYGSPAKAADESTKK